MSVKRKTLSKAPAGPRRSPSDGGYERGEQARAQIIDAALRVFAEEGYARATTRRIASEARVNPPALQYYFDSKEGLHAACGQFMVERHSAMFAEPLAEARRAAETGTAAESAEAAWRLLDAMFVTTLDPEHSPDWAKFLARTQADADGPAFVIARDAIHTPVFTACAILCARAMERPRRDPEAIAMALFLMNMLSSFSVHQASGLSALGWNKLTEDRKQVLRDAFRRAVFGALR
jgi:AcrR family transcriptional regulator